MLRHEKQSSKPSWNSAQCPGHRQRSASQSFRLAWAAVPAEKKVPALLAFGCLDRFPAFAKFTQSRKAEATQQSKNCQSNKEECRNLDHKAPYHDWQRYSSRSFRPKFLIFAHDELRRSPELYDDAYRAAVLLPPESKIPPVSPSTRGILLPLRVGWKSAVVSGTPSVGAPSSCLMPRRRLAEFRRERQSANPLPRLARTLSRCAFASRADHRVSATSRRQVLRPTCACH